MNCQKGPTTSATLSSPDSKRDESRTIQTILPNSSPNASQSQIKPESWKLMENPPGFDPKQRCFRILGICKEWPKYTIKQVVDPRKKNRYWIPREDDLEVPDFWIDDEYCAIPPRREIAVTGLNDNINENLLTEYCSKIGCIPLELHLYRHPKTNEHLRMALIDFKTKTESQKFISSYDQKPIMGSKLTCFFDTFAYKLSELYKAQTGKESEYLPKRYGGVFNSNTIENIRRKIQQESLAAQLDKLPEIAPEKNGDFIDSCISTEAAVLKAFRTNVAFEKNKNESSSPYYLPPPPLPPSTPHLKNGFRLAISPYSSPSQTKRPRQDFSGSTKRNYQHSNNRNNLSFKANHLSPNNLNNKRDHYSHKRTETSSQRYPKPDSSFQQRKDTKSAEILDKQFCSSEPGTSTTEASKLPGPIPTIIKSSDIPKYVKNSLRIDLVIKLQQDIDKKIQTEMLKHLNELWHEKEQKRQIELSTNGPPSLPPALTTEPFFQYGGKFPPAAYGLNTISIFGMPYYERIANMPKIRKKPQLTKITETKATRISVFKKRSGLEQEPSQIGFSRSRSIGSISQRSDAETEKGDESICTRSRSSSTESHSSSSSSASTQTEFSKTPSLVAGGDNEIQPSSFHMNDETCIKTELNDFDTGSDQSKKAYSPIPDIDSFSFEVSSYNEHIKQISKLQILPPKIWAKRNEKEESNVLYKHLEVGFNNEECKYLKQALANMERKFNIGTECVIPKFIDNAKPSPVEMPTLPCKIENKEYYYADSELDGVIPHKSGCARAEGYYKVSQKTKSMMRRYEHSDTRNIISTHDENTARQISQALKNERAMNRGLVDIAASSSLCSVNQLKYRAKMIKFARSRIHGWGLYALQTIAPDEMIIEYVGEKIRPSVSDNRERAYETRGMGSSYMFRIDDDAVVDATMKGNFARFINHSCTPNCYAKILPVSRDKRIVIYSKRTIQKGEEITYDYKFPIEDDKIPCLCGSVQCRGSLN